MKGSLRRRRRLLISSGPTREPIDPVRFLSNYSTGYMGYCLAREARRRGYGVTVVSGPAAWRPLPGARVVRVEQAGQMRQALARHLPTADALIMAAAVCDFRPAKRAAAKLPRHSTQRLSLIATPDILASLPVRRGQVRVGFALETSASLARVAGRLKRKRLDLIVGQSANGRGGPFGQQPVEAVLLSAAGGVRRLGRIAKPRLARALLDEIEQLWYGGVPPTKRKGAGA